MQINRLTNQPALKTLTKPGPASDPQPALAFPEDMAFVSPNPKAQKAGNVLLAASIPTGLLAGMGVGLASDVSMGLLAGMGTLAMLALTGAALSSPLPDHSSQGDPSNPASPLSPLNPANPAHPNHLH